MTTTVDACIIAALETKLAQAEQERDRLRAQPAYGPLGRWTELRRRLDEAEQERDRYLARALAAETRLATAHDALHDCGFTGGTT